MIGKYDSDTEVVISKVEHEYLLGCHDRLVGLYTPKEQPQKEVEISHKEYKYLLDTINLLKEELREMHKRMNKEKL